MPHWEVGDITPTLLLIYNLYCLRRICTQNTTEAVQHQYNVGGLFVWAVGEDDKNSSQVWTERRRKNPTNNWSTNQLSKQLFKQWDGYGIVLISYCSARAPAWPGRANSHLKRAISQQGISNKANLIFFKINHCLLKCFTKYKITYLIQSDNFVSKIPQIPQIQNFCENWVLSHLSELCKFILSSDHIWFIESWKFSLRQFPTDGY